MAQPNVPGAADPAAQTSGAAPGAGGGDALDKGIDSALGKTGHQQSHATTEKISDGARNIFKKVTGKDAPIKDKEYQ